MKTCTVQTCSAKHHAKGLCRLHYRRSTEGKHGLVVPPCKMCGGAITNTKRIEAEFCGVACQHKWHRRFGCYREEVLKETRDQCSIESCEKPVHANGMCTTHNMRIARYGDHSANYTIRVPQNCSKCGQPTKTGAAKELCSTCYAVSYYHANHTTERARRNARRTRTKIATPSWADRKAIRIFYAACPPGHEVDHAVPLLGEEVCGLHVPWNLQYLPMKVNRSKGNKLFI